MEKENKNTIGKKVVIPKNITKQIVKQSKHYGESCCIEFYNDIIDSIEDNKIKSPIEQLLYSSLLYDIRISRLKESRMVVCDGKKFISGIEILPQFKVGKYIVDFKVTRYFYHNGEQRDKIILIECDSQQWHERTEEQRRLEKERDRFLLKNGYKVFHYTGKDILENAIIISEEILAELGGL